MAKRLDIGRYGQIPPFCHCKKNFLPPQFAGFLKIGFWGPTYKKPSGTKWFYYDIQNVKSVDSSVRDGRG
jgi:hypothetical protein